MIIHGFLLQSEATEMYKARSRMKCADNDGNESQTDDEEEEQERLDEHLYTSDIATDSDSSESDLPGVSDSELEVPFSFCPARKRKKF